MRRKREFLERSALQAGVPPAKARQVVAMDLDSSSPGFWTGEELARETEDFCLRQLGWLVKLAQEPETIDEFDIRKVTLFVHPHLTEGARPPSPSAVLPFIRNFVAKLSDFVEKRTSEVWTLKLSAVSRVIVGHSAGSYQSSDWRQAFLLRAGDLIDNYGHHVHRCANSDCRRLFVGRDPRQRFCSPGCSATERLRRFRAAKPDWTDYRREGRKRRERQQQSARLKSVHAD